MDIQFSNYYIIGKRLSLIYTLKENHNIEKLKEIYLSQHPLNGRIFIKSKTLDLIKIPKHNKKNILHTENNICTVYFKHYKTIIKYIKQTNNEELKHLLWFFELSHKTKSEFITIQIKNHIP